MNDYESACLCRSRGYPQLARVKQRGLEPDGEATVARCYYYPGDEAGVMERLCNRVLRKPVPNFPRTVVIETQSGCNGGCVFCSYPQLKDELPRGRMSDEVFEKIARECSVQGPGPAHAPVERFILCLDNEPLLDPKLAARYALLKQYCPESARNLTTNASLLSIEKVEQLAGTGLINELFLSVNGVSKEVYEQVMALPYEQVMRNLEALCAWLRRHPEVRQGLRVRINTVRLKQVVPEIPALRKRWEAEGFEVHVIGMDSRGDQLDLKTVPDEVLKPNSSCRRLFHTMVFTWAGEAVLCCVDYKRAVKLGDVRAQGVYEIWNGPWSTLLRKEYLARNFAHLRICATCKVNSG